MDKSIIEKPKQNSITILTLTVYVWINEQLKYIKTALDKLNKSEYIQCIQYYMLQFNISLLFTLQSYVNVTW